MPRRLAPIAVLTVLSPAMLGQVPATHAGVDPWAALAWVGGLIVAVSGGMAVAFKAAQIIASPFRELGQLRALVYGDKATDAPGLLRRLEAIERRLQAIEDSAAAGEEEHAELYRALLRHLQAGGSSAQG